MSDPGEQSARNPDAWKEVRRFSVLDPSGEVPGSVFPTVYVTDELLIEEGALELDTRTSLQALARKAGWSLDPDLETLARTDADTGEQRSRAANTTIRVRLGVAPGQEQVAATPDAWALLRQARHSLPANDNAGDPPTSFPDTEAKPLGVSLNHVLTTDSLQLNQFKANPFGLNQFKANPLMANAETVGIASYAALGTGGRQPVTFLGPEPRRRHPEAVPPIVAIFDTGCGSHPWLNPAVIEPRLSSGAPIGIEPMSSTNPERHPTLADASLGEPMEGFLGAAAGHGTFIAGIVRQECPDAMILPVRVADGDGVILENVLIEALHGLIAFMKDVDLEQKRGGSKVKVLNLSFSFFHEKPGDTTTLSQLQPLLDEIRGQGCVVVCSAGNDATSRPTYPAAIPACDPSRQVSVGALNPSDRSVALFSNVGNWVDVYAPGVSLLSTVPVVFDGGVQAGSRDDEFGHRRETLDVDDFRGGFGVWSGTSFAAPVVAGRIAEHIVTGATPEAAKAAVVSELRANDLSRNG